LAEIIAYAMAINLFLMFAEIFKEYYSNTAHMAPMQYLYQGYHGNFRLTPWIWTAMVFNIVGFLLFLMPRTRERFLTLNIGCGLIFIGIWIEKGMGLIVPGFIPDTLHDIHEYMPSLQEVMIGLGIWAFGGLLYTLAVRMVIALDTGRLRHPEAPPLALDSEEESPLARDIMTRAVQSIVPATPVEAVRRLMSASGISGFPVVDEQNRVLGVVSESDIILYEINQQPQLLAKLKQVILPRSAETRGPGGTAVDIMSAPAITARDDAPLRELSQELLEKKIKRIIIVDQHQRLAGVVSRIDIVKAFENLV
jgi:molybdopterin-containing oxidoreductase family membrane subunit